MTLSIKHISSWITMQVLNYISHHFFRLHCKPLIRAIQKNKFRAWCYFLYCIKCFYRTKHYVNESTWSIQDPHYAPRIVYYHFFGILIASTEKMHIEERNSSLIYSHSERSCLARQQIFETLPIIWKGEILKSTYTH